MFDSLEKSIVMKLEEFVFAPLRQVGHDLRHRPIGALLMPGIIADEACGSRSRAP